MVALLGYRQEERCALQQMLQGDDRIGSANDRFAMSAQCRLTPQLLA
jgi:hypothetical protein